MARTMGDRGLEPASPAAIGKARERRRWRPYQIYLVALLLLISVFNYLDRSILALVQEQIKHDLALSDFQLGLLGGPAFALCYSLTGLPVAWLADRSRRAPLIAGCVAVWSMMTSLCGAAQTFGQLALCRFGMGGGEGGAIPISQSLLADEFPARQRGIVMSILAAAYPIAAILLPLIGGLVAAAYGWRWAFAAVGLPGMILAALSWLSIREPRRAATSIEPSGSALSYSDNLACLLRNRAFLFLCASAVFLGIGYNGIALFEISFMVRTYHLTLVEAGAVKGLGGLFGLGGTVIGGLAADWFAGRKGASYVLVPAAGGVVTALAYWVAFASGTWELAFAMLLVAVLGYNVKNGPLFAAVQNIVSPHMRTTGAAIFMFSTTVLGGMIGPPLAGFLSDTLSGRSYVGDGAYAQVCRAGSPAAQFTACKHASALGLQEALGLLAVFFLLASLCLYVSSRTIRIYDTGRSEHGNPAQNA